MRVLVLGGSSFVGRAVVEDALARGWSVATFNRGRGWAHPEAERLTGDRLDPATLAPLGARGWDVVVDTWAGAPRAAHDAAALLAPCAGHYAYISSASVYGPPPLPGGDESQPTVDPGGEGYAADKRGAELAVERAFGDRALLIRCGLILGPHEDVGRLPWWLERIARGGDVLAPGPPEQPLQLIDARDLARFTLDAASSGQSGPFNTISRRGHATMSSLLRACITATGSDARLIWATPQQLETAGIAPWTELPIWLPPDDDHRGLHATNVERAHAAGLTTRPVAATVADTWSWLESVNHDPPLRPDLPPPGLDAERERALLAELSRGGSSERQG